MLIEKKINTENFTLWLIKMRKALRDNSGIDVPCGNCIACCTSSYIIHVYPDEKETISAIPKNLIFEDPDSSSGIMTLKSNKNGHCLLMNNKKCLIYHKRSWICRIYDCRLLTAAGLKESVDKKEINKQVDLWRFSYTDADDYKNHMAVQNAAAFIIKNKSKFPFGYITEKPIQQAATAVKVFELFKTMRLDITEESIDLIIIKIIETIKKFDA